MPVVVALAVVVGVVAFATALGLLWRARTGRVRTTAAAVVTPATVESDEDFGESATLLQFSTQFCAPCRATHGLLETVAAGREGVSHVDVDLTDKPQVAQRFNVLQTPTTLLLDSHGVVRARIGGAPRREELLARLDEILRDGHVELAH